MASPRASSPALPETRRHRSCDIDRSIASCQAAISSSSQAEPAELLRAWRGSCRAGAADSGRRSGRIPPAASTAGGGASRCAFRASAACGRETSRSACPARRDTRPRPARRPICTSNSCAGRRPTASQQNSTSPRPAWTIVSWPGAATASQKGVTSPTRHRVDHGQLAVGRHLDQAQHRPVGVFRDELRVEGDGLGVRELSAILPQLFVGGDVVVLHVVQAAFVDRNHRNKMSPTQTAGSRCRRCTTCIRRSWASRTPDFSAIALTMKFGPLPM